MYALTHIKISYSDFESLGCLTLRMLKFKCSSYRLRGRPKRHRGREVLQMRTSASFGAKNFVFFEIYGACTDKGDGHFADKGREI